MYTPKKTLALLMVLTLAGCATMPPGPSVMVLPAQGKPFDVFQDDDAICREWAAQRSGSPEDYNAYAANSAVIGTLLGAGVGAMFGAASGNAGAGAVIGAGGGLLAGTLVGADSGYAYGYDAQRRYDTAYLQCMYSYGNQVPTAGRSRQGYKVRRLPPPPPPEMEYRY